MADNQQMILEGDLGKVALPRVLESLAIQGGTGILTIQGEEDIVAVSYLKGHIVAADALNQTVEDGLGKILSEQNLVRSDQFAAVAREHQGGSSGSLGELLVARELITREQLLDSLRRQTFQLMLQVLTWHKGEYKFYGGDEVSFEEGVVPISVAELLVRALEELGEQSGVGGEVPQLNAVYRRVPPRGPIQVIGRDGDGSGPGTWLSEQQENFLVQVDGRSNAVAIAKANAMGRYQTLFCLHQLLERDLIELVAVARPAARTSPTAAVPLTMPAAAPSSTAAMPIHAPPPSGVAPRPAAAMPAAAPAVEPAASAQSAPATLETPAAMHPWIGPCLGLLLLGFLVLALIYRPASYLQPFPWQETQRSTAERQLRQSAFERIDRVASVYFLMEAHYPDDLSEVTRLGMLSSQDLRDPAGFHLKYVPDDLKFRIDLIDGDQVVEGLGATASSSGDFLLDPSFVSGDSQEAPLVLLD